MRQRASLFKIIYASQVSTVSSWLGAGSPAWRNVIWPVVGFHCVDNSERLKVVAALAQARAAGLEALLNRNANTLNRSASRFDDHRAGH